MNVALNVQTSQREVLRITFKIKSGFIEEDLLGKISSQINVIRWLLVHRPVQLIVCIVCQDARTKDIAQQSARWLHACGAFNVGEVTILLVAGGLKR